MKTKKNMAIGLLCMALVFMGLGYSLFSTTLNITGSSQGSGSFDVKITNVEVDENNTTSGATDTMDPIGNNYAVTETNLSATFNAPGDQITYDITVTNRGSIDAVISVETNMLDSTDSFELSCTVTEGTEVAAGGHISFPCVMKFKESVESFSNVQTAHMTVSLNAVQKATYESPSSTPFEIPDYIINNDGVLIYSNVKTSSVTIPDSYNGKTITAIGTNLFKNVDAAALMYNDGDSNKIFPLRTLTPEEETLITNNGFELITYEELLDISLEYYSDNSGRPYFYPICESSCSSNLTTLDLSNMVHLQKIYADAFEEIGLSSVTFPMNGALTHIGYESFRANSLQTLNLPNTLRVIDASAFEKNLLSGSLTIPASVEVIERSAFANYPDENQNDTNQISSVVFSGTNLTRIGNWAFYNNNIIGSLVLPDSVESIKDSAFYNNRIEEVHLGSNIEVVGQNALVMKNNTDLKDIYIDMPQNTWESTVTNSISTPITSYYWYNGSPTMHYNSN